MKPSPSFAILANFDAEMTWGGVGANKQLHRRLSSLGGLLSILAPEDADVDVYAATAVDPACFIATRGWRPPTIRTDTPAHWDLAWADPGSRALNDRRFCARLAREAGVALPGAATIASIAELEAHLAGGGAAASPIRRWVAKATWSAAGRDRCIGVGDTLDPKTRGVAAALLERGPLQFEPWMDRIADVAMCAVVDRDGTVLADAPHRLITGTFGQFLGIELASSLEIAEHDQLAMMVETVGTALAKEQFRGPFGVDAFVYRDVDHRRRLHPLCEINARHTFGHVARAFGRRLGITRLGFREPPAGATMLLHGGDSGTTMAWVA